MKRTALGLLAMTLSTAAFAEDFDPAKFGLVPEAVTKDNYCVFLRNAVEGKKKVWKCADGTTRYGETNIWGKDGVPRKPEPEPPEDMTIHIEDGVLLTVEVVADKEECHRTGRHRYCDRYSVPDFSYLMTSSRAECEHMAPRLAARQYIVYRDLGVPAKITFKCEGASEADTGDFMIYPIPGMPSIMGIPGGF